jgi:hypothetical protein
MMDNDIEQLEQFARDALHRTGHTDEQIEAMWTCPAIVESVFKFTRPASRTEAG